MPTRPQARAATLDLAAQAGVIFTRQREDVLKVSRHELARRHELAANTLRELELGLGNPTVGRLEQVGRDVYGIRLAILEDHNETEDADGRV